jgi:hypothetical protein
MSNQPVFVFSACWRTGSTLVQRFLNTSDNLLIWGEPNFLLPFYNSYTHATRHFRNAAWQQDVIKKEGFSKAWSPILCPSENSLLEGYRNFFKTTYETELASFDKSRWGFKEVRQNAYEHASMMKTLFPDCRIIFHHRHPFDIYASLKHTDFHKNFPDPFQPMRFYAKNMARFLDDEAVASLGAIVIRHEDFIAPGEVGERAMMQVAEHAAVKLKKTMRQTLAAKVGATAKKGDGITEQERNKIVSIVRDELKEKSDSVLCK